MKNDNLSTENAETKAERLENLQAACSSCRKCSLGETRTHSVFGAGNSDAALMFVGEAPGEQEDKSGIPFVGAAGKLLDKYLFAVGIPREDVYIANILKCRPPKNRDPNPDEEAACMDFLRGQVRIIQPSLIVCLGRIAAMKLIKPDFRITAEHGIWFEKKGLSICALFHPSALLRDPRKKEAMLEDMKILKKKYDDIMESRNRLTTDASS